MYGKRMFQIVSLIWLLFSWIIHNDASWDGTKDTLARIGPVVVSDLFHH